MSDPWLKYEWLDLTRDDAALMAGCIGVVRGSTAGEVRERLNADAASVRQATVEQAWTFSASDFGNDVVQIAALGEAVVTFEPNGWHGVDARIAKALSEHGRYAAYFWNVNSVMQFVFAEAGSIVRDFDPLLYDGDEEHELALPEEEGLPWPSDDDVHLRPGQASLGHIVQTGYVPTEDVICHAPFGHQLLPAEVERAYRRQLEMGDQQAWPPPTGYWRDDHRFVLTDGRNRFVACLMLGHEHLLVAWLVPDRKG